MNTKLFLMLSTILYVSSIIPSVKTTLIPKQATPEKPTYGDIFSSIWANSVDGIEHAINQGVDIFQPYFNPKTNEWTSLLHYAAQEAGDTRILDLLISKGLDPEQLTDNEHSVIWYIITQNNTSNIQPLVNFINEKINGKKAQQLRLTMQPMLDRANFAELSTTDLENQENCPICLENLKTLLSTENKLLVRLNCGHIMCADEFLDLSKTLNLRCPTCRAQIESVNYVALKE